MSGDRRSQNQPLLPRHIYRRQRTGHNQPPGAISAARRRPCNMYNTTRTDGKRITRLIIIRRCRGGLFAKITTTSTITIIIIIYRAHGPESFASSSTFRIIRARARPYVFAFIRIARNLELVTSLRYLPVDFSLAVSQNE